MLTGQQAQRVIRADDQAQDGAAPDDFCTDMLAALSTRPRCLSPKYFYDEKGSLLFDRICELPEYYPTRTELGLLARYAGEIAEHIGPRAEIVEFGAGSLHKIRRLLDALNHPLRYMPVDISGAHLAASATELRRDYPCLTVLPVVADYTGVLELPAKADPGTRRIGFFPGSTIGNLSAPEALLFLQQASRLLRGGAMLLGVDLVKDPNVLHAAYNDAQGVTAAFNLNILVRANRELNANFNVSQFVHSAFYNSPAQRIEMHLMSRCAQQVRIGSRCFAFAQGETLHTENSHKFTIDGLHELAIKAGFEPGPVWTDPDEFFSLHWLQANGSDA